MNSCALPARNRTGDRLCPALEDAMHELGEKDRHAVLLRFFQKKSLKEVGLALGLGENGARMRVERAVEKLRAASGAASCHWTLRAEKTAFADRCGALDVRAAGSNLSGAGLVLPGRAPGSNLPRLPMSGGACGPHLTRAVVARRALPWNDACSRRSAHRVGLFHAPPHLRALRASVVSGRCLHPSTVPATHGLASSPATDLSTFPPNLARNLPILLRTSEAGVNHSGVCATGRLGRCGAPRGTSGGTSRSRPVCSNRPCEGRARGGGLFQRNHTLRCGP